MNQSLRKATSTQIEPVVVTMDNMESNISQDYRKTARGL